MAEDRIWAPWRLEYIKQERPSEEASECIFCTKPKDGDDEAAYIVHRGRLAFVMLNAYPYNNGHLMIAPYEHVATVADIDDQVMLEIMQLTKRATDALEKAYSPEGYNIGINQGRVAGAGVEHHIHLHVVPRWGADTNFMPVLADARVLPQQLSDSYRALKESFE